LLLGVRPNLTSIISQKLLTEPTSPQYTGVKIQTFQLTSNDPTSKTENVISLELSLYYSNHCRNFVERTVDVLHLLQYTQGVLQPSPFKKFCPEIYEGREVHRKTKNGHMDHFFGLSSMKVGLITFSIPGRDCAFCR
jgi:hypothetical protein